MSGYVPSENLREPRGQDPRSLPELPLVLTAHLLSAILKISPHYSTFSLLEYERDKGKFFLTQWPSKCLQAFVSIFHCANASSSLL